MHRKSWRVTWAERGAVRCGPLCLLVNKIKFRILKREVAGGADREARVTTDRQHCRSELNGPVGDTSAETRWGPLVGWGVSNHHAMCDETLCFVNNESKTKASA